MKKILVIAMICAILLLSFGCISKEQAALNQEWQNDILSLLDYEAEVSCWESAKGGITANIKPINPVPEEFGGYIIQGVRAAEEVIGYELKALTIGYSGDDGVVVFTLGDANYGTILDSSTEQAYYYATEADIAIDYPAAAKYLSE